LVDAAKLLKLKIMDADFKEVGKVKSLEIQNWKIIGISAELNRDTTDLFFGKSTFRLSGENILLPPKIVKDVGDVLILNVSGPNLMAYSKLGKKMIHKIEEIKKDVNSMDDVTKFSKRIEKEMESLIKEIQSLAGVSPGVKNNIKSDLDGLKNQLVSSAYEKLGIGIKED
jgi:sporulation protein YlmC with PRC-barrel domain